MAVTINGNGAVSGLGDITYGSANPVISGASLSSLKITSPNGESRYFFGELGNTVSSQMSFYDETGSQKIRIAAGDGDTFFNASNRLIHGTTSHSLVDNGSTNASYENGGSRSSSRDSTSTRGHLVFYNPNGQVGGINTSGSSTSFNTSSDYRLKENVVAISDGITRLKTLKPSRFNFIADATTTLDGFLAHE